MSSQSMSAKFTAHGRNFAQWVKTSLSRVTLRLVAASIALGQISLYLRNVTGADDFITKPFDLNELLEKIERWL